MNIGWVGGKLMPKMDGIYENAVGNAIGNAIGNAAMAEEEVNT